MELPAHVELSPAWNRIRAELRRVVGGSTFEIWLAPVQVVSLEGSVLRLRAPEAIEAWVSKRYSRILGKCVRNVLGEDVRITFEREQTIAGGGGRRGQMPAEPSSTTLNPRYSFDQFIIGDGNRMAHAAALAAAEMPGQAYNPLFLHAPPGLGKTHLLHAIGNYILAFGGGATVRYTTVEAFTNHFINALSSRSVDRFKDAYRHVDVLLIDDVQFLASKAKTEEEFFHTFNALYDNGRQLVLTCDRLPQQLSGLEQRLRERFEAGLVTTISPPDFATRVAILRKRAALDHIRVDDDRVLELIAERVTDNVRVLEGTLIRTVAYHSLTGRPIDIDLTQTVLGSVTSPQQPHQKPAIDAIQATVAEFYGVSMSELTSSVRTARVAWPRHVAIHLARRLTDASLPAIGAAFGGRNHATVMHACRRVKERITADQQAAGEVSQLTQKLQPQKSDRHS